ncbi:MAG: hypothetical protein ACFFDN_10740 [Candidatus Hodarchaeota archaeon]
MEIFFFNNGGFKESTLTLVTSMGFKYKYRIFISLDFYTALYTYDIKIISSTGTIMVAGKSI